MANLKEVKRDKAYAQLELVVVFNEPVDMEDVRAIVEEARNNGDPVKALFTIFKNQEIDLRLQ